MRCIPYLRNNNGYLSFKQNKKVQADIPERYGYLSVSDACRLVRYVHCAYEIFRIRKLVRKRDVRILADFRYSKTFGRHVTCIDSV